MLKIAGFILIEILIYTLLRQTRPEYAVITEAAAGAIIFFMLGDEIKTAFSAFSSFFFLTGKTGKYIEVLMKIAGLALVSQFTADLCRDSGNSAAASKVEFAGKIIITSAGIPVLQGLTELLMKILEGL